jgi:predicted Fe-Mo cluster-binding NifX family protein
VVTLKIAVPTENTRGLRGYVAEVFSRAPFFTIIDLYNGEPKVVNVIENSASPHSHGAGPLAVRKLNDEGVEILLAPDIGIGASSLLNEMKIKYRKVEKGSKISSLLRELKIETSAPCEHGLRVA